MHDKLNFLRLQYPLQTLSSQYSSLHFVSPYGATTIAGGDGKRQPSDMELAGARHQGELIAKTAIKLFS